MWGSLGNGRSVCTLCFRWLFEYTEIAATDQNNGRRFCVVRRECEAELDVTAWVLGDNLWK